MSRKQRAIYIFLAVVLCSGSASQADDSNYQQGRNARIHAYFEDEHSDDLRAAYRSYESALVMQKGGNSKEAAKLFRQCRQVFADAFGANDPMDLDCSANLCVIEQSEKSVGAEARLRQIITLAQAAIKDKDAQSGLKKAADLEKQNKLQESALALKESLDTLVLKGWIPSPDYKDWKDAVGSKVSRIWA